RSLSESAFSDGQDHLFFGGAGNHRDDEVSLVESYSDDTVRLAAHLTNVGMVKTNTHAGVSTDKHRFIRREQLGGNQLIVIGNAHRNDPAGCRVVKVFQ